MVYNDLDVMMGYVLGSDSHGLVFGVEHPDKVQLTGTINGTNDTFQFPATHYPIYPKSGLSIIPQPTDVTVWAKKGEVYTEVTVASIELITDPDTGDEVYGAVKLQTPPTSETADSIHAICWEEFEPYVAQDIGSDLKQDTGSVGRIRSKTKVKTFKSIEGSLSQQLIIADMDPLVKLLYKPYTGSGTVQAGYEAWEMRETPQILKCYIPYEREDEIVGRFYMDQVRVMPKNLPTAKEGDDLKMDLDIALDTLPRLIRPEAEA